jgi:hypothetical protein
MQVMYLDLLLTLGLVGTVVGVALLHVPCRTVKPMARRFNVDFPNGGFQNVEQCKFHLTPF